MEHYDIIVVGTGFCGATVANLMARSGKRMLMLERRMHVAGNMYDEAVEGILEKDRTGVSGGKPEDDFGTVGISRRVNPGICAVPI